MYPPDEGSVRVDGVAHLPEVGDEPAARLDAPSGHAQFERYSSDAADSPGRRLLLKPRQARRGEEISLGGVRSS
jgi:hypothetical protein